jgi:arylesterase/paraoxonase
LLFVINHQQSGRQVVEKFKWQNDSLEHIESIEDSLIMTSPNDLVAVDERRFYVTNDHYYMKGPQRVLEEYLQRAISYVNYYDGNTFRTVAEGIGYANGINQSPDGHYIFVAACTGRSIFVYKKDEAGSLTKIEEINVGTGPDNIDFDEEGNLLVACHPQLLKFVAHAKDVKKHSPSQVLKIKFNGPDDFTVNEVLLNDGFTYSGSSIAVTYGNTLLIGSVFEPSLLYCTLKK